MHNVGFEISIKKIRTMRISTYNIMLQYVNSFCYLVTTSGGAETDVNNKLNRAKATSVSMESYARYFGVIISAA